MQVDRGWPHAVGQNDAPAADDKWSIVHAASVHLPPRFNVARPIRCPDHSPYPL
jgi:hypothetical protein